MRAAGHPIAWIGSIRRRAEPGGAGRRPRFVPLATKLVLSHLLIVAVTAALFGLVGTRMIGDLIMSEARSTVRNDLNAAREILHGQLNHVTYAVRFTAARFFLRDALLAGRTDHLLAELRRVREQEGLDFLTLADGTGHVLLRTTGGNRRGDTVAGDPVIREALGARTAVSAAAIMPEEALWLEAPALAERARIRVVPTPRARPGAEPDLTSGLVLEAAAPILEDSGAVLGVLYGGILLNRNFALVDKIKATVFQGVQHQGRDIGTATVFLDDVRITTNVTYPDGSRAIGTRIAADVYDQVVGRGRPWIGRAYVVRDWYIAAYEPIVGIGNRTVGILYVGVLEQKYLDIRRRAVIGFLGIMLGGAILVTALSTWITHQVSRATRALVFAAHDVAAGNLNARVKVRTNDELAVLADTFNRMATALRERDERLKEAARRRMMESERLAVIGQLAAGVAHELNNPLQGIVTYAHLLLERTPAADPARDALQKIAAQADRCREIIRSLLDFSRPRKPQLRPTNLNTVLRECLGLVERQALFHNITVVTDFAPDLPEAILDPAQVQQVFMNLIINAAEAMGGAGTLTLVTRADPAGGMVEARVTDTGHGIAPEDLDRIFDPFFTTKGIGHGTGLGLSISYGIVKEHRGTIAVESEVGRGTTFTVRFPVTVTPAAEGVKEAVA
ncbi:MAG: cache domain-containing protein [Armatimonadota bacterium]|nr:cache domain-containing protein [Armatimonadota bacterium]MDR7450493.1 cache domain-containing protein [Armatimonadota bacterium]MDR7466373.1 cache domain-containing protein [Armatimonadota bacterium]MDR7493095.1 cache domain-containing protein [Armatimonadota bacterium]MDR7498148.1 cache domain-containing protein [Armatimonadota bacterium]